MTQETITLPYNDRMPPDLFSPEQKSAWRAIDGFRKATHHEDEAIEGWLEYGDALNEGRKLFASNELFGKWKAEFVSSKLEGTPHPADDAAAMWAAANPEQFKTSKTTNPRVRTVRGIHEKWKEAESERMRAAEQAAQREEWQRRSAEASRQTDVGSKAHDTIRKLTATIECGATPENVKIAATTRRASLISKHGAPPNVVDMADWRNREEEEKRAAAEELVDAALLLSTKGDVGYQALVMCVVELMRRGPGGAQGRARGLREEFDRRQKRKAG